FEGREYLPALVTRTAIKLVENAARSELSINFSRTNSFARDLLDRLPETPITVIIYRDNLPYWVGRVTGILGKKTYITVACNSSLAFSSRSGFRYKLVHSCQHSLYSAGCGVIQSLHKVTYTNIIASSDIIQVPSLAEPDQFYNGGIAVMAGQSRHIIESFGTSVILSNAFTGTLTGEISLYRGCDLSETTCKSFNNLDNFMGFSRIPTKNPFGATGLL
ncbi:MAG: phage BR0599 family protein, partial [bacterium]|nr:phage BR0599 family protein [bacterium]